jgi:hypothetical protein
MVVMKMWNRENASSETALAQASGTVLSDPNYQQRRALEERKYAVEGQARTLGEGAGNVAVLCANEQQKLPPD